MTAKPSTTSDVVLDANILVGILDDRDSLHLVSVKLLERAQAAGRKIVFLDFLVEEALGVLVRRAKQRKSNPPVLSRIIDAVSDLEARGLIESTVRDLERKLPEILELVSESTGALNPNDAKIVILQRAGLIGEIATLDQAFASFPGLLLYETST